MDRRIVFGAMLAMAIVLFPAKSQARWMNPKTGRFQTMDTYEGHISDPLSLHKYLYVGANPVNRIDPSGHDGTEGELLVVGGGLTTLAGLQLPAISGAQIWTLAEIGVAAIAISATLGGDQSENDKNRNVMRLQLQEGLNTHFWSVPIFARARTGVTRKQVQLSLAAMFTAVQLQDVLEDDWERFYFSRWETSLWGAIIRMSARLNSFGPVSGTGTVMQEYLDPTDQSNPRIDLENLRGTNLRK